VKTRRVIKDQKERRVDGSDDTANATVSLFHTTRVGGYQDF
jgi:hypothetical protein